MCSQRCVTSIPPHLLGSGDGKRDDHGERLPAFETLPPLLPDLFSFALDTPKTRFHSGGISTRQATGEPPKQRCDTGAISPLAVPFSSSKTPSAPLNSACPATTSGAEAGERPQIASQAIGNRGHGIKTRWRKQLTNESGFNVSTLLVWISIKTSWAPTGGRVIRRGVRGACHATISAWC
ncbi:hypothetical protein PS854_04109 [Pseudomonas fluorescens]|uniref:Uncharacterized protein n=1 Tax=Pseudomonas fluorescens TaxID=294 RepID=A0A5E7MQU7_PSEFL|nr:hypothetical protein PS854_04109 [Pseudomonas fluorescens]